VARIERAIDRSEHIRLVTDYDVDGTTSCLILHAALDRLVTRQAARGSAAEVSYHVPDRFAEGYGLSMRAVERAAADGVTLLVTADIGVRDHATVRAAAERGIDVLVCDHHLQSPDLHPQPMDRHLHLEVLFVQLLLQLHHPVEQSGLRAVGPEVPYRDLLQGRPGVH
jgi:single-stranded DNA-specific DHH superfamily exonuclease